MNVLASAAKATADPAMGVMSVAYHGADEAVVSAFAAGILSSSPAADDDDDDEAKKYFDYSLP